MNRVGGCDALALLVLRLESSQPDTDKECWHAWDESPGAEPQGLPEGMGPNSGWTAPFKHLPGDDALPYFNSHIERLLFPPGNQRGARWVCCPDDLTIELGMRGGGKRRARIDLLERVTTPLEPARTFGLIHFSLLPKGDPKDPGTLWWRKAIASPFRQDDVSELTLMDEDTAVNLSNGRPVRALTEALFGDPDPHLERGLYMVLMARHLPEPDDPSHPDVWRRALASPFGTATSGDDSDEDQRKEFPLAGSTGLMRGNAAVFTLKEQKKLSNTYARNFRSYWTESIVFGLMQQDCLEEFQHRLAEIRDLRDASVEKLYGHWLEFRNVLWWSHLASSRIPQRLLSALRDALGTERFFTDLEGDLATYSEYQHQCTEDRQETALANLQIYGSGIVVLGPLTTVIGLVGATGGLLASLLVASLLVAGGVSFYVSRQLNNRSDKQRFWLRRALAGLKAHLSHSAPEGPSQAR
jgi:hypothetical protein